MISSSRIFVPEVGLDHAGVEAVGAIQICKEDPPLEEIVQLPVDEQILSLSATDSTMLQVLEELVVFGESGIHKPAAGLVVKHLAVPFVALALLVCAAVEAEAKDAASQNIGNCILGTVLGDSTAKKILNSLLVREIAHFKYLTLRKIKFNTTPISGVKMVSKWC